jgi:hypothetical protein
MLVKQQKIHRKNMLPESFYNLRLKKRFKKNLKKKNSKKISFFFFFLTDLILAIHKGRAKLPGSPDPRIRECVKNYKVFLGAC